MTANRLKLFLLVLTCCLGGGVRAQLTVNTAPTPQQLVQNFLLGTGVSAANVVYNGGQGARGSFNCAGPCNLGLGSGVLLTSGSLGLAIGPNNLTGAGTGTGTGSDSDLNLLNPGGTSPQDASVLEFDFTVATDSVRFRYVFGSEEYSDFVGTGCNDVFGFFINGPGITGKKNIARIPGTNTPILINNVNNGFSPGLTSPNGPCTNCAYFRDNHGSTTLQYDGLTTVLTAGSSVCPCETYHIKLAVQDFCDGLFDSGVFLEQNSFSSNGINSVSIMALGNPLQIGDTVYICPGDSVEITSGASTDCRMPVWSTNDTAFSIMATSPGAYYCSFVNFNPFCFASTPVLYVDYIDDPATITPQGPTSICPGDSVVLSASSGTGYLWSTGATTRNITVFTPGAYYCTVYRGANPNCAAFTDTVTVSNLNASILTITASGTTTFCQGNSVVLTASDPQVNWSNGSTTQSITVTTAGSYTAVPVSPGFCPIPATVTTIVLANPTVSINGPLSSCQGSSVNLNAGGGFSSYQWSNGSTAQTIQVSASGTYSVTVSSLQGCTATVSAVFNALPFNSPSISGPAGFCNGGTATLSAIGTYSAYRWSNGSTASDITVSTGGNYTVTVTASNGCSGSASSGVNAWALPSVQINGPATICQGKLAVLRASAPATSFSWSTGAATDSIVTGTAGSYTVNVTDTNGCSSSASFNLQVNPNPSPSITGDDTLCDGEISQLDAGGPFIQYSWSNGQTTATIQVATQGGYGVVVTDQNGCTGTVSRQVTVHPLPLVSISGDRDVCFGESSTLETIAGQGTYLWSTGSSDPMITVDTDGFYTVTVTNPAGCTISEGADFRVHPVPAASYDATQPISCEEILVEFKNTSQCEPSSVFTWDFGDGTGSSLRSPSHEYTSQGEYHTRLIVVSPFGCADTDSQLVTVLFIPPPEASFTASEPLVSIFNSAVSFTNTSTNAARYKWNFGDGQSSSEENPVHIFDRTGTNSVTLIAANGEECLDEYTLNIEVAPFFIPNAFSPNDDGKNDVFFDGTPVMDVTSFNMRIFNRWGEQIYETDAYTRPWDGTQRNGTPCQAGLYTYLINIVSIKGKPYEFKGTFNLVR